MLFSVLSPNYWEQDNPTVPMVPPLRALGHYIPFRSPRNNKVGGGR